ncbi:MAG TPA: 50S ribosomal protein L21 [Candidatus Limnocylindria bacterium]|nr:50S ribosomal protein L21 [Candidatus Limnocylindria bacterium]
MYAIIETGGKQYRVELGTEIEIDRLEAAPGETIELGRVLLLADGDDAQIGRPVVDGAAVSASVVRQDRGDKVVVFKYRPKARRRVKRGHRQELTVVRIADIRFDGRSAAQEAEAQAREAESQRKAAEQEAARKAAADKALADKLAREQKAAQDAVAAEQKTKPQRGRKAKADEKPETDDGAEAGSDDKATAKATTKAKATDDKPKAKATDDKPKAKATDEETLAADEGSAAPKRTRTKKDE